MNRHLIFLTLLLTSLVARPVTAGVLFNRQPKPNPAERVPTLVTTLKTDANEHQRHAAAEELRQYDSAAFPEMVQALIEALQRDLRSSVRAEAAQTLGKLRPVSQQVGNALEQAAANDSSMRVRLQARSALWSYHFAGYRSSTKTDAPPLLQPGAKSIENDLVQPASQKKGIRLPGLPSLRGAIFPGETPPPPLADPTPPIAKPQPVPSSQLPSLHKPGSLRPAPPEDGPVLIPPG